MRQIDQQWGVARALLGLGDLARFRDLPGEAHERYAEALPILREIGARPQIARCLAELGRVAMDLGATGQARRHLTGSLRLSHAAGARAAVARGLEAFAALAGREGQPELAVQLLGAAAALRGAAGLPQLAPARAEEYLAPARCLGEPAIARLRARGLAMDTETAVMLALGTAQADGDGNRAGGDGNRARADCGRAPADGGRALAIVSARDAPTAPPGPLTSREHQVAVLVAGGRSNDAIADELSISPATAARHVTNIMAKLGLTARAQIAAWAATRQP